MNDAEFKAYVADLLININYGDLKKLEKDIFKKLEMMGILTLDQFNEVVYVKGGK